MDIVSTHGIASFLNEQVNAIGENTRAWEALVKLVIDSANDPLALSHAEYWAGDWTEEVKSNALFLIRLLDHLLNIR